MATHHANPTRRTRRLRRGGAVALATVALGSLTTAVARAQTPTTVPDTDPAVWPYPSSTVHYHDPVEAARAFAVDFAGFKDPVLGEFQQGDTRSGEIDIRATKGTDPLTHLALRMLGPDSSWYVLFASSTTIELTTPDLDGLSHASSPLPLAGRSQSVGGTVHVQMRQDGSTAAIGSTTVTGGRGFQLEPFSGSVTFTTPTEKAGALLLFEQGQQGQGTITAVAARVHFATAPATTTTTTTVAPVPAKPNYTG
jgi:hypothetical protein